jgi:hypothetical protein
LSMLPSHASSSLISTSKNKRSKNTRSLSKLQLIHNKFTTNISWK